MASASARRAAGFTLLELLIVIVVFAVMATMAYGGLSQVLKVRSSVEQSQSRTEAYQMFYVRLRADLQNAAIRSARDNDGVSQPAFLYDNYNKRLEFTRGGWANPLYLPRTGFERVSYRLDQDKLIRSSWRVLDRAPQSQPVDVVVMDGVEEWSWRFMDPKLQPSETWPPVTDSAQETASALPPVAAELTLRTKDWGLMRFLFKTGFDSTATNAWSGPTSH